MLARPRGELCQLYLSAKVDLVQHGAEPRVVHQGTLAGDEPCQFADLLGAHATAQQAEAQIVQPIQYRAATLDRAAAPAGGVIRHFLEGEEAVDRAQAARGAGRSGRRVAARGRGEIGREARSGTAVSSGRGRKWGEVPVDAHEPLGALLEWIGAE